MEAQTLTQTVNIVVGQQGLLETGFSFVLAVLMGVVLLVLGVLILGKPKFHLYGQSWILGISLIFIAAGLCFAFSFPRASASPTLSLASNQTNLDISIPEGGGQAMVTTTLSTGTTSPHGYTLAASLTESEPGITMRMKGGDITTDTDLSSSGAPLTIKTTSTTSSGDVTDLTLSFTIDETVAPGAKLLKLVYTISDFGLFTPTTMQSMTTSYCQANMTIYDGTNEEVVLHLTDNRGGTTQAYRVAKLADNNCWMLDNLKLGSTSSTTLLTPVDTDIDANLTLPQIVATGTSDYDNPGIYGPVPGDTGMGATNYGYLYNWSAATAGESSVTMPGTGGSAPYSICPAGWRLPTGDTTGEFADLDRAFGGTGTSSMSGEPNITQWHHNGPFKGVFAGALAGGSDSGGSHGVMGLLWSSSGTGASHAFYAGFNASGVYPALANDRDSGFSIRCILR